MELERAHRPAGPLVALPGAILFLTSNHPDSAPFLLVHARQTTASDDVIEDDADTTEIPASKSVPPHAPPARVITSETDLPSVIVDLKEIEVAEVQRGSEVDGLLVETEALEATVAVEERGRQEHTQRSRIRSRTAASTPRLAIALVAALSAAGATFAGLKVSHVPAGSLGAALHVSR
jgi:hypothetical protein